LSQTNLFHLLRSVNNVASNETKIQYNPSQNLGSHPRIDAYMLKVSPLDIVVRNYPTDSSRQLTDDNYGCSLFRVPGPDCSR